MQSSKNKSICAYAKSNKLKAKDSTTNVNSYIKQASRADKKENVKDEIFDEIDIEDDGYINKLLQKQQKKGRKKCSPFQKQNTRPSQVDHFSSATITPIRHTHSQQNIRSTASNFTRINKMAQVRCYGQGQNIKHGKKIKNSDVYKFSSEDGSLEQSDEERTKQGNEFIKELNDYLSSLEKNENNIENRKYSNFDRNERNFRKSIEKFQRANQKDSIQKYELLKIKYKQAITDKDCFQKTVNIQERKINQMKQILKGMYLQIGQLNKRLHAERQQNQSFNRMFVNIMSQLSNFNHRNKQESFLEQDYGRRTHIFKASNYQESQARFTPQSGTKLYANKNNTSKANNAQCFLKKIKKIPRYKTCQLRSSDPSLEHTSMYEDISFQ